MTKPISKRRRRRQLRPFAASLHVSLLVNSSSYYSQQGRRSILFLVWTTIAMLSSVGLCFSPTKRGVVHLRRYTAAVRTPTRKEGGWKHRYPPTSPSFLSLHHHHHHHTPETADLHRAFSSFSGLSSSGKRPLFSRKTWSTSTRLYSTSSPNAAAASFQVGDVVQVQLKKKNPSLVTATILEVRGSGWYTVQDLEQQTIHKVRTSQLQESTPPTISRVDIPPVASVTPPEKTIPTASSSTLPNTSKKKDVPTKDNDAPTLVPPPPPTIIDLDAAMANGQMDPIQKPRDQRYLEQVANHAQVEEWVVFTDLHCSPTTLTTTLDVLQTVHDQALQRALETNHNVGVMFLGDFWHHRGSLRVDCLNAVLHHLNSWTVPMVMIPGNHDQVTLGGHNHGLTPLEHSYRVKPANTTQQKEGTTFPGPLIFSHPTLFQNALFVPHIRDHARMEAILQCPIAQSAKAIFCHADVQGASMNELIRSERGVPPGYFPEQIPIYSGHFHKPHVVEHMSKKNAMVRIEYIGSPYEVSLAEAQQSKALVVLKAPNNNSIATKDKETAWQSVERIPLHIGCRHFRAMSMEAFLAFVPTPSSNEARLSLAWNEVREGDRVVVTVPKVELEAMRQVAAKKEAEGSAQEVLSPVDSHAKLLREIGATVEIREGAVLPQGPRISMSTNDDETTTDISDLSIETTWRCYLDDEVHREAMSNETAEELWTKGMEVLTQTLADDSSGKTRQGGLSENAPMRELDLYSVSAEGFGPFEEKVTYPLRDRGLVLLRGSNLDDGSDSNGSGKTSLAMSALWAMTGNVDPRPMQDQKVVDVINDYSKSATVVLDGSLNGKDFSIARMKTPSKGSLTFLLDGEDLTTQSVKETQALIYETFGVNQQILARTMFRGQHSINDLLEATDTKLKDELSLVVPLDTWQSSVVKTRKVARDATQLVSELDGKISVRSEEVAKHEHARKVAEGDLSQVEDEFTDLQKEMKKEVEMTGGDVYGEESVASFEAKLQDTTALSAQLDEDRNNILLKKFEDLATFQQQLEASEQAVSRHRIELQASQREKDSLSIRVEVSHNAVKNMESKWGVDLSLGSAALDSGDIVINSDDCPTCGQSMTNHDDSCDPLEIIMHELRTAVDDWESGNRNLQSAELAYTSALTKYDVEHKKKMTIEDTIAVLSGNFEKEIADVDARLQDARLTQQSTIQHIATMTKHQSRMDALTRRVEMIEELASHKRTVFETAENEWQSQRDNLQELHSQRMAAKETSSLNSALATAFGQRGVQAFVMQQAVMLLGSRCQHYLSLLSDGVQRIELAMDHNDKISRRAWVRGPDGSPVERPLATLSGGQWRRCSLAMELGFSDLVVRKGRFRSSFCVLDEPLTHLDRDGRTEVGRMFRGLLRGRLMEDSMLVSSDENDGSRPSSMHSLSTVLMILQDLASEELEEAFDCVDEVRRSQGKSNVLIDEVTSSNN